MKANELMIGDWVKLESYNCKFIQLTTIDETYNSISYFDADAEGELTLQLTAIEPIPLTQEILEKNGFEQGWWWRLHGENLWLGRSGDEYRVYTDGDVDKRDNFCWIKYVHELQHILQILKIEKGIKL